MEFERSLFRIHERLIYSDKSEKVVNFLFKFFIVTSIFSLLRFIHYHKAYVNDGNIL